METLMIAFTVVKGDGRLGSASSLAFFSTLLVLS
jgi:hypothetical protein